MLLNHEFFAEGVKIEALSQQGDETEDSPLLHLRMEVPTKEVSRKNNQESIEFTYDLDKDQPEVVVGKMVSMWGLVIHTSGQDGEYCSVAGKGLPGGVHAKW